MVLTYKTNGSAAWASMNSAALPPRNVAIWYSDVRPERSFGEKVFPPGWSMSGSKSASTRKLW